MPQIPYSTSGDIYTHQALEEHTFNQLPEGGWALLLTCNDRCVVIGKHQNPWVETHPFLLAQQGIPLARRISGGGAVFHDRGNLNYSLMLHRDDYDRDAIEALLVQAMASLGVATEIGHQHILLHDDRKFSGTAFCFRKNKVMHHGTMLVNADLESLRASLRGVEPGIQTKAVSSNPWSVMNLADVVSGLTCEQVAEALGRTFCEYFGTAFARLVQPELPSDVHDELVSQRHTWEWQYGETPRFSVVWETDVGTVDLAVAKGIITEASGPLNLGAWMGQRFDHLQLANVLEADGDSPENHRLATWIRALIDGNVEGTQHTIT